MLVKEFLYHYTIRVGRRIGSKIMVSNAWHHRSDAIASLAALIVIAGALMGWHILDPVAAIGVSFFVGKVGIEIAIEALRELTDAATAIDKEIPPASGGEAGVEFLVIAPIGQELELGDHDEVRRG